MSHSWLLFNKALSTKGPGQLEFEMRIEPSHISDSRYDALLRQFISTNEYELMDGGIPEVTRVTYFDGGLRVIEQVEGGHKRAEIKTNITNNNVGRDYRISINRETPTALPTGKNIGRTREVRERERLSFSHKKYPFTVVFTKITSDRDRGEVEIEYNTPTVPMTQEVFKMMTSIAEEIVNPYNFLSNIGRTPVADTGDVVKRWNSLLMGEDEWESRRSPLFPITKPIDLELTRLKWHHMKNYMATFKANGERMSLFLESPDRVYNVTRGRLDRLKLSGKGGRGGSLRYPIILDGEWVEDTKTFYMFDCVVYDSKYLYGLVDLPRRVVIGASIIPSLSLPFNMDVKPYFSFATPEQFGSVMREMRGLQSLLPYKVDGLIFEPISLSDLYRPMKWKPTEEQTLDFTVLTESPLVGYRDKENKIVPLPQQLMGTKDAILVLPTVPPITLSPGDIGEFKWDKVEERFMAVRKREDKKAPNTEAQVLAGISLIRKPISWETLSLQDLTLSNEYYLSSVNDLIESAITDKRKRLLDLSGSLPSIPTVITWVKNKLTVTVVVSDEGKREEMIQFLKGPPPQGLVSQEQWDIKSILVIHSHPSLLIEKLKSPSFPVGSYDIVTMLDDSLSLFPDTKALFEAVDPLLKIGGVLILSHLDGRELQVQFPRPEWNGDLIKVIYPSLSSFRVSLSSSSLQGEEERYLVDDDTIYNETTNYGVGREYRLTEEQLQPMDGKRYNNSTSIHRLHKLWGRYESDTYEVLADGEYPAVVVRQDSTDLLAVVLSGLSRDYVRLEGNSIERKRLRDQVHDVLKDRIKPHPVVSPSAIATLLAVNLVFLDANVWWPGGLIKWKHLPSSLPPNYKTPAYMNHNLMTATSGRTLILLQANNYEYYLVGKMEEGKTSNQITTNFHHTDTIYIGEKKVEW